jgi:hypothetical protein
MTNLATLPADIRLSIDAQRVASLWISYVVANKWTPEKVKLEISRIEDAARREEVRKWCRHYRDLQKIANPPAPAKSKARKPTRPAWARGRG